MAGYVEKEKDILFMETKVVNLKIMFSEELSNTVLNYMKKSITIPILRFSMSF